MSRDDRRLPASAEVTLEAGGDHRFDLGHLRREGASQLVRLLLETAGYHKALPWRVRVEKKINCHAETKPVTIVGSKVWCCYLKIKPGDNNTAHFCSLLMPNGYRGEVVYEALKDAEERVNFAWRSGFEEVVPVDYTEPANTNGSCCEAGSPDATAATQPAVSVAVPLEGDPQVDVSPASGVVDAAALAGAELDEDGADPRATEILGWSHDPDKLRLTLLAIHEVGIEGQATVLEEFVSALENKLGWHGLRRRQIGGLFTCLVRRGYIVKLRQGSQPLGYALTTEGRQLIHDLLQPGAVGAAVADQSAASSPAAPASLTDPAGLMMALTKIAQEYTTAYQKLQENRARPKLLTELHRLDAEASELSQVVSNPEVQGLLQRLTQLTGPANRPGS